MGSRRIKACLPAVAVLHYFREIYSESVSIRYLTELTLVHLSRGLFANKVQFRPTTFYAKSNLNWAGIKHSCRVRYICRYSPSAKSRCFCVAWTFLANEAEIQQKTTINQRKHNQKARSEIDRMLDLVVNFSSTFRHAKPRTRSCRQGILVGFTRSWW